MPPGIRAEPWHLLLRTDLQAPILQVCANHFDIVCCSVVEGEWKQMQDETPVVGHFVIAGLKLLPQGVNVTLAINDSGILEVSCARPPAGFLFSGVWGHGPYRLCPSHKIGLLLTASDMEPHGYI